MLISDIRIEGFRSYKDSSFSFKDGANIIWGENARGKTNLLEAVMLLSGAQSWRSRKRGDIINFYEQQARITGRAEARSRVFEIKIGRSTAFRRSASST